MLHNYQIKRTIVPINVRTKDFTYTIPQSFHRLLNIKITIASFNGMTHYLLMVSLRVVLLSMGMQECRGFIGPLGSDKFYIL